MHESNGESRIYLQCLLFVGDRDTPERNFHCCPVCHEDGSAKVCCFADALVAEVPGEVERLQKEIGQVWHMKQEIKWEKPISFATGDSLTFECDFQDGKTSNMKLTFDRAEPTGGYFVPWVIAESLRTGQPVPRYRTTWRGRLALFTDWVSRTWADWTRFDWWEL
jgi:hypothetical protein